MKLKEKIKKIVANKKPDFKTLDFITKSKSDAVSNNSMDLYRKLGAVEHSLYRYNSFLQANLNDEAEKEAENLNSLTEDSETGNVTLYGGVSNTVYRWETEPNACEKCQELDGTEYESKEDIPEKPHPNCKCKVVEVKADEEPCDCHEVFAQLESLSEQIDTSFNELLDIARTVTDMFSINIPHMLDYMYDGFLDELDTIHEAYHDFQKNKAEMIAYKGYDKYYHAKANCEATQRGIVGEVTANTLSVGKEVYDIIKKTCFEGMSLQNAWRDSMEDLTADMIGGYYGRNNADCAESLKNIGDIFNK